VRKNFEIFMTSPAPLNFSKRGPHTQFLAVLMYEHNRLPKNYSRPPVIDRGATATADNDTNEVQQAGADEQDAVTDVANVDLDDKSTNQNLSYVKDVGNMTITQSAKTMLDLLDDLSMSEGLLSDISFGHFEPDTSLRTRRLKPEVESRSPLRPKTSKPNSKTSRQALSSSSHRYHFKQSMPFIEY
jgi:hypothetical protein